MSRVAFRSMTDLEHRAASALSNARFAPATFDKRFARSLRVESRQITDKQAVLMWTLVHRYRRSIADSDLVEIAEERIRASEVKDQPPTGETRSLFA